MRKDYILRKLEEEVSDNDILELYHKYAEDNHYEDIYPMSDFDELIANGRSYREVKDDLDDDFNENDEYFYVDDGTGYICSTNDIYDVVDLSDLAVWINDEGCDMGCYELSGAFHSDEEAERIAAEIYNSLDSDKKRKLYIAIGLMDEADSEEMNDDEVDSLTEDFIAEVIDNNIDGIKSMPEAAAILEIHNDYVA